MPLAPGVLLLSQSVQGDRGVRGGSAGLQFGLGRFYLLPVEVVPHQLSDLTPSVAQLSQVHLRERMDLMTYPLDNLADSGIDPPRMGRNFVTQINQHEIPLVCSNGCVLVELDYRL
jgi:hypothetical protein